jgi:FAD/FMN-containing dehydrogenase
MGKVAEYLRSHLDGEITDASDVREHFSQDAGLFKLVPEAVVYPFGEQDIRKVARFAWQLAEKGRRVAITSRGLGSDWSGGAVGESIIVNTTTHMNKILELDSRKGQVVLEPGATVGKINQTLFTHGLFLPFEPISSEFSTIGGAIATNASGMRSAKYGTAGSSVDSLRVVLSNGDVISTGRITKREMNKRMGQANFEGEIYRGMDAILTENADAIASYQGMHEFAPLNIFDVRKKDGSIDLTPMFVGSQGSLGVVTQARVGVTAYNPSLTQIILGFYSAEEFYTVAPEISKMRPSIFTVIAKPTLQLYAGLNPLYIGKKFGDKLPEYLVLLEFDEFANRSQKKSSKKIKKLVSKCDVVVHIANTERAREEHSKLFRIPGTLIQSEIDQARTSPGLEAGYIPPENIGETLSQMQEMFSKASVRSVTWYDYQTGVLRILPYLDLRQLGQRQKLARLIDQYSEIVLQNGGVTGIQGGGRVAATYHKRICGDVLYEVIEKVKQLFDPYNIMNPGVKFGTDPKAVSTKTIQGYSHANRHNHLPR